MSNLPFQVNVLKYDEDHTHSTMNISNTMDLKRHKKLLKDMHELLLTEIGASIVSGNTDSSLKTIKQIFGRQQCCKQYTHKNFIWSFSDPDSRNHIYAMVSKEGVSWEYDDRSSNPEEVLSLMFEVREFIVEQVLTF